MVVLELAYDESKLINLGHLKDALEVVKEHIPENTDTKVTQTLVSDNVERPILTTPTAQSATTTTTSAFSTNVKVNASTGNLTATKFTGDGSGLNVGTASGNAVYTTTSGKLASGSLSTTDPTTGSSPSLDFIATISQDAKGKITATKQTVKDMVGSNGTDAGTHGLVPSPSVSDNTKFLKGDGTWATPTNTDTKVTQTVKTDNVERPILTAPTAQTATTTTTSVFSTNIKANASTGTLTATKFVGDGSGLNVGSTSGNAVYTTTSGKLTSGSLATTDPTTGSSATLAFIATVSQDAKGKITATKQTVKDMTGANGTNAGTNGLVPAPVATDNTKYLKGDGTWDTPTNTDTKVNVTKDETHKAYLLGTTTTPSTTAAATEAVADTNVYLETTAGNLHATQFNGSGAGINVGSTSGNAVYTTTSGKLTSGSLSTSDPTSSGTAVDFIATISQDAKGKITATKSSVTIGSTGGAASYEHTHGNITNVGALQTTDITIANGDKLVVTDSSDSDKVARTSISFDGSTTTQALSKKGTWVSYAPQSHASTATTYGKGSGTNYGHVKLSDATDSTSGVADGVAATPAAVKAIMDVATGAMTFKGTIGTGGTVTSLPDSPTKGDTYKVITAGTYGGKTCKVGDTLICLTPKVGSTAATWELIPSGDEPSGTVTSVKIQAGSGIYVDSDTAITTSGTRTISHADTSNESSLTQTTRRYINKLTLDDFGHVTAIGTNTETVTDTHYTSDLVVTNSATGKTNTTSAISTNGNVYLNHVENNSITHSHKISGSGAASVTADASGNIIVNSTDTTYAVQTGNVGSASAGTAISADDITAWSAGSVPSLVTEDISCDDITAWSAGTAASASVSGGVLTITNGSSPSLTYSAKTAKSVKTWDAGSAPSLSYTSRSIPNISVTSTSVVTSVTAN